MGVKTKDNENDGNGLKERKPSLFNKLWPCYLNQTITALTYYEAWFAINIIVISEILWPGEDLHAIEMGLFYGLGLIAISLSRFL